MGLVGGGRGGWGGCDNRHSCGNKKTASRESRERERGEREREREEREREIGPPATLINNMHIVTESINKGINK